MLHEIILVLHGCKTSALSNKSIELTKVLHPSEKAFLKRLIQVGQTYSQLQSFIDKHICPQLDFDLHDVSVKDDESHVMDGGMYLQAFCDGLNQVLQPYRDDVVQLEKVVLQDPYVSLSSIHNLIGVHVQLLNSLHSIIDEIKKERLHGCKLLQYVCKYLCTGVEFMREAMLVIAKCCHSLLIKQLTNWLVYGQLLDKYGEFFIKANKNYVPISAKTSGASLAGNVDSDPNVNLGTSSQSNLTDGSSGGQADVFNEFTLDDDFLPPYIMPSIAYKILYIGKTVKLFKCDLTGKSEFVDKSDIFHQNDLESIKSLQNCSFQDTQQLQTTIIDLESSVTERLWSLAVNQADLKGQMNAIKEFYLLSRGELFVDFLNKVGNILNKSVSSSNIARDLNVALLTSARNVQYPNEAIFEKFQFKLPPKESCAAEIKVKSVLRLEYSPTLPLHLFFSPIVIDNYNILFRFFLRVKQAQLNLHSIWIKDVKNKKQLLTDRSWQLRNDLMFLVENLQCYLQWDVVESKHSALMIEVNKNQDFEKIRNLHHRYLFNILSQAFLVPVDGKLDPNTGLLLTNKNAKPNTVLVFLGHILDLSEAFCQLVMRDSSMNISDEIETMSYKLSHCVKVLIRLITNLRNHISGVHLSKLLLRLDYNHYFSFNNEMS